MTDLNRWHLDVKEGRQRWMYSPPEEGARAVQNVVDRYLLGLDTVRHLLLLVTWRLKANTFDDTELCNPRYSSCSHGARGCAQGSHTSTASGLALTVDLGSYVLCCDPE